LISLQRLKANGSDEVAGVSPREPLPILYDFAQWIQTLRLFGSKPRFERQAHLEIREWITCPSFKAGLRFLGSQACRKKYRVFGIEIHTTSGTFYFRPCRSTVPRQSSALTNKPMTLVQMKDRIAAADFEALIDLVEDEHFEAKHEVG
jgi:hypothetical protein